MSLPALTAKRQCSSWLSRTAGLVAEADAGAEAAGRDEVDVGQRAIDGAREHGDLVALRVVGRGVHRARAEGGRPTADDTGPWWAVRLGTQWRGARRGAGEGGSRSAWSFPGRSEWELVEGTTSRRQRVPNTVNTPKSLTNKVLNGGVTRTEGCSKERIVQVHDVMHNSRMDPFDPNPTTPTFARCCST